MRAGALVGPALAQALGDSGLKVACALAAKNIGGGLNFIAVAAALGIPAAPVAAALAIDNVMALVYFPLCSLLGRGQPDPNPPTVPTPPTEPADAPPAASPATAVAPAAAEPSRVALSSSALAGPR